MELYLCRHGETEWTLTGQHTGKTDVPLTARGKEQSLLLRKRLEDLSIDHVFTSPRLRARASCEGLHAEVEPLAVEWDYGDYEGLTTAQIHAKDPHWDLFTSGAPRGESVDQVGHRADLLLRKLVAFPGRVVLFSHGHFLRVLAARYLGLAPEEGRFFLLSVASLSILSHERQDRIIALWNDTSHLMIKK
jgi:probable phosphoglycerate mutase